MLWPTVLHFPMLHCSFTDKNKKIKQKALSQSELRCSCMAAYLFFKGFAVTVDSCSQ